MQLTITRSLVVSFGKVRFVYNFSVKLETTIFSDFKFTSNKANPIAGPRFAFHSSRLSAIKLKGVIFKNNS